MFIGILYEEKNMKELNGEKSSGKLEDFFSVT